MKKIFLVAFLICSAFILKAAPTVSFSNITATTMIANWSSFGAGNVLVVMRASATPITPPNGFASYTPSTSFGTGTALISSSTYALYRGAGTSISISSLTTNTNYYIAVYSYTYNAFTGYSYTYEGGGSHYTLTTQPTTIASGLTVTKVKPTSAFVSCTAGNGVYRIITVKTGSTNSELPTDGTVYSANSIYGNGAIITSGAYTLSSSTSTGFTFTGLSPATTYAVSVFEYNGTNGANNYLTSSYATTSFTTPATEPTSVPTSLSVTNLTGTSATLNWNNGDGLRRIVSVKQNTHSRSALAFDGTDDYLNVGTPTGVNTGTGSFTIEGWIKTSDAALTYKSIVSKQNAINQTGYWLGTFAGYIYYEVGVAPGGAGNTVAALVTSQYITDGAWHHVALVANRASGLNCSVYIDGILESSTTSSLTATTDNSTDFTIGSRKGTTDFFVGQLDEIRLWNTTRSQSNIQSNMYTNVLASNANLYGLWRMNEGDVGGTTTSNSANNTGSTLDATLKNFNSTAIANSFSLSSGWVYSGSGVASPVDGTDYVASTTFGNGDLIGNNYIVMDGSENSVNITGLSPQTLYNVCVYEYNGSTNTINYLTSTYLVGAFTTPTNEPTIPASGLTLTPVSPTSITASWTNGDGAGRMVLVHAGKEQTALAFDGVNDSVSIPHHAALNSYPMTITAWVKTSDKGFGYKSIATKFKSGSGNGFLFYISGGSVHGYYVNGIGGSTLLTTNTNDSIADNKWHHVAYVVDASGSKIYIDGTLRSTASWSGTVGAHTSTQTLTFGGYAGTSSFFSGQLDEVAIFGSAISSGNINYLKNRSFYGGSEAYSFALKGYWKFDEGSSTSSTITNSSLTALSNGTLTNFGSTTAATNFTGTSGWVYSGAGVNMPLDQYTNTYFGNSIFSSPVTYYGNFIGNINYMVYTGTGNSVTVTGLSPNTTYNFSVIEYNGGATDYNFMTSNYLTGNGSAQSQSAPTITSFSPTGGGSGAQVTITGTNFNTTVASNIVYFGASKATVLSATATQLTVLVPFGATFEPISVTNNSLTGYSATPFDVTMVCTQSILDTRFSAAAALTSNGNVVATQVADMDMDGRDDLLALNDNTNNLSGFRNTASGGSISFATSPYAISTLRTTPTGFATDDIDGDGKLDVVAVNKTTNTITVSRSISFSGYVQVTTEAEYTTLASPQSVAIADLDKDGKADVVVAYANDSISIFRNTSSVNFVSFATRQDKALASGITGAKVALGDMDVDGKVDIVLGCTGSTNMISSFRNTTAAAGNITFAAKTDYTTGISSAINALAIGKVTNDNFPEVCFTQGTSSVVVAKNNSTSGSTISFTNSGGSTLTALANTPADVAFADIDGDNFIDLVVGYSNNATGAKISVFENNNSAAIVLYNLTRVDLAAAGTAATSSLAIADFNNDGKNDIAAGSNTTAIVVFTNEIGGALSSEPSNPATTLGSTSVTQTTATLSWTNSVGSSGGIVVVKPSADLQVNPIDGVDYTAVANSNYGTAYHLGANNKVMYAGSSNTVNITGLSSNTSYRFYVYEYQGSGCDINYLTTNAPTSLFTTLNNAPVLNTISNPATICQNSSLQTVNLSGINDGGEGTQTISISATSNNTTLIPSVSTTYMTPATTGSLSYTPAAGKSGTAIITVTVSDGAANNSTAVKTFTVTVDPAPPTSKPGSDQLTLCSSTATLGAISPGAGYTGTWSILYQTPGGLTASVAFPNNPTSTINNIDVGDSLRLRWTVSSGSACTPTTGDVSVKRINCSISADFTANNTTICKGSNVNFTDLSATQTGSINQWNWNFGDAGTSTSQSPSHTYSTAGTYTVSLTVTNTLATTASITKNAFITVTDVPGSANPLTGVSSVCAGQVAAELFLTTAISGADYYMWTLPTGASITSGDSTINVYVAFAGNATSGNITVAGKNSCGLGTASTIPVTVKAKPEDAGSISGQGTVCDGSSTVIYTVPTINNATSYSWSFTGGAVIAGGNGTNSLTVNFPAGVATNGNVSVYGMNANGCGNGNSSSLPVSITTKPVAAGSINGTTSITVCPLQAGVTYSVPLINGATSYVWDVPTGASIVSGQGTNAITVDYPGGTSSSGNVSVYGVNACGNGAQSDLAVTVMQGSAAATTINGTHIIDVCPLPTGVIYFVDSIFNATSYDWNIPNGAVITSGQGTNKITVDFTGTSSIGYISVKGSNTCGIGDSSTSFVTVNSLLRQEVCLVTLTDSLDHCKVIWDKHLVSKADSFRIYRVDNIVSPTLLGSVSVSANSEFIDLTSDPAAQAYVYKIQAVDSCGNLSDLNTSNFHKTSHVALLQDFSGDLYVDFVDKYVHATDAINGYEVWMDTIPNNGHASVSHFYKVNPTTLNPLLSGYTISKTLFPKNTSDIRVYLETIFASTSCDPNAKTGISGTKSGIKGYSLVISGFNKINPHIPIDFSVYPNPSSGTISIHYSSTINQNENKYVVIQDIMGQEVLSKQLNTSATNNQDIIDISELSAGSYFISLIQKELKSTKHLIVR